MKKVWFITGTGKGIGCAIANAALKAGDFVVATTRKDNALNLTLDVSDPNQEAYIAAAEQAVSRFGRIDILVNNAGHGRITNFEETCEENIRELFEVNFSV